MDGHRFHGLQRSQREHVHDVRGEGTSLRMDIRRSLVHARAGRWRTYIDMYVASRALLPMVATCVERSLALNRRELGGGGRIC